MERTFNYFPANITIPVNAKISVKNLPSPRTGEPVKNQFCISIPLAGITCFQSYDTTCLVYDRECYVLTVYPEAFGYSVTTSKYSRAFLRDEIGLAEWVDAKIYSIEQADLEDDEDSPRKPSTDKPQYSSSKNSKQSKPKPKTEENVSARSINLSSMNFKNKIFGGIKVKDSVSSRSQIKDNNKSAENEDNENVVKVKEVKEPTKFKLSSSPKIRIRGAVSSFKRPKK